MISRIRIIDEGPGSHSFVELSKQQFGFLGTSVIFVNRPGLSERLIRKHLIPKVFDLNASIIFPLPTFSGKHEKLATTQGVQQLKIAPKHIYQIEKGTQSDSAEVIAQLRSWLRERSESEKKSPVIFIFDSLHKWAEELEAQIRYLIQEAAYLNISVWIHSPIFLIPSDLIPTIGNVVIIWPSKNEIRLLTDNLPDLDVKLGTDKQDQGLFLYNKTSGKGWQFIEFSPQLVSEM